MEDRTGLELMRLYRELRTASDPKQRDLIKARIDAIVAQAHAQFQPGPVGRGHSSNKTES
jgi:hypothetical protein